MLDTVCIVVFVIPSGLFHIVKLVGPWFVVAVPLMRSCAKFCGLMKAHPTDAGSHSLTWNSAVVPSARRIGAPE
jgi:hypothetical protein